MTEEQNGNKKEKLSSIQAWRLERQLKVYPSIECTVALERRHGVYFPGDVVKGQVRLLVPFPEDGQLIYGAVYWQFVASSQVAWVESTGDSEIRRIGTTIFEFDKRTLLGMYHCTANIRDTTDFSHTLLIPCEDRQQELIIELVKKQRNGKEKVVGEVRLNVVDVVDNLDAPKAYPLSNNKNIEIVLSADWRGESLDGYAENGYLRLHVHRTKRSWKALQPHYVRARLSATETQQTGLKDSENDGSNALPTGETIFPFSFKLPENSPGSSVWAVDLHTAVSYQIAAFVSTQNEKRRDVTPASLTYLTVLPTGPNPCPVLLSPIRVEELDQMLHSCHCGKIRMCKRNGLVSIRLALEKLAFAPGELVNLSGSNVTNDSSSPLPVQVILRCHMERRHTSDLRVRAHKSRLDFLLFEAQVPGTQTLQIPGYFSCGPPRIPPVFPSFDGGIAPSHDGEPDNPVLNRQFACLKWSYTLELRAGGDKARCATGVYCRIPILICPSPALSSEIDVAPSQSPIVGELSDAMSIFKYTGSQEVRKVPGRTSLRDSGTLVMAERSCNLYSVDSKTLRDGLQRAVDAAMQIDYPLFKCRPLVKSFDPHAIPAIELNEPCQRLVYPPSDDEVKDPTVSVTATTSAPLPFSGSALLGDLLSRMEDTVDNVTVIRQWTKDHPDHVEQLSAEDMATVISKVTFLLDQESAVKELLAGCEGRPSYRFLTCAHVTAVMEACQCDKAEVAKLMVPYVKDPENRENVLMHVKWEFQRDSVDRMFSASSAGRFLSTECTYT